MISTTRSYISLLTLVILLAGCYTFRDISIPQDIKTARINFIENRARYINPLLSPQLTDKLRQKVNNQTKLTLIQGEDADYEINATITDYSFITAGISDKQAATNRLNVTVHVVFQNRKDPKADFEADVSRNFDFSASLSLQQAETQLQETIVNNLSDEIFNRIFSSW